MSTNETPDMSWFALGECQGVDPDLFFPDRGASTSEAKEVCRGCAVREQCLEHALTNGEKFGVWGGLSERERRRIRRDRARERAMITPVADAGRGDAGSVPGTDLPPVPGTANRRSEP